jgi:hypothetical protein
MFYGYHISWELKTEMHPTNEFIATMTIFEAFVFFGR